MREPLRRSRSAAALIVAGSLAVVAAACSSGGASTLPSAATTTAASSPAQPSATAPAARTVPSAAATVPPTPTPSDGSRAGQVRTDAFGIEQVWVPAGSFTMGTSQADIAKLKAQRPPDWVVPALDAEAPAHKVTLTKGYWIDRTEVTNTAYKAFVDAGGYTTQAYWSDEGRAWLATKEASRLPLHCQGDVADQPRMCLTWYEAQAYAASRGGRL